jgi:hypothetical protein
MNAVVAAAAMQNISPQPAWPCRYDFMRHATDPFWAALLMCLLLLAAFVLVKMVA